MTPDRNGNKDFPFIEGLRGCAALQVIALHYCCFFLPVLGRVDGPLHFSWETTTTKSPIFFLLDGYSAVYLFFLMSGFVLARSFLEPRFGVPATIIKRFLRLFLPIVAAVGLAIVLTTLVPSARLAAETLSGSAWAAGLYHNPLSVAGILKDVFLSSLVLGYQDGSVLAHWSALFDWRSPASDSFVPPLWTLHLEFWGSMLVLALAQAYRRLPRWLFVAMLAGLIGSLRLDRYGMFPIGFCAYLIHDRLLRLHVERSTLVGLVLVLLAACIAPMGDGKGQTGLAAILLFAATMLSPPLRRWLASPWARRLGRLSFSIYLLHFPILFTAGAAIFVASAPLGYLPACFLSLAVGTLLTFGLAELFERIVDRRAITAAGMLAAFLTNRFSTTKGRRGGHDRVRPLRSVSPPDFPG